MSDTINITVTPPASETVNITVTPPEQTVINATVNTSAPVLAVNGKVGYVTLTASDVGITDYSKDVSSLAIAYSQISGQHFDFNIPSGSGELLVNFPFPYSTRPVVQANLRIPPTCTNIYGWNIDGVTTGNFRVFFSDYIQDTGIVLSVSAFNPSGTGSIPNYNQYYLTRAETGLFVNAKDNQIISGIKNFKTGVIYLDTSIISAKSGISANLGIGGNGGNIYLDGGSCTSSYDIVRGGSGGYIDLRGGGAPYQLPEDQKGAGGAGGWIQLKGGDITDDQAAGNGGYIQANGGLRSNGGFIELNAGGDNANGGYIKLNGAQQDVNAGYIEANGYWDGNVGGLPGGFINLNSTSNGSGGSLNLSAGGGSIDTRGQGKIEFGVGGTRTILSGTASTNRTIYLPDQDGTIVTTSSNIVYTTGNQTLGDKKNFTGTLQYCGNQVLTGIDLSNYYSRNNPSGYITGNLSLYALNTQTGSFITSSQTGSFITTSQTGNFYAASNPSGYITGVNLLAYTLNANTGSFITTAQTGSFYTKNNPSGYITGVAIFTRPYAYIETGGNDLTAVLGNPNLPYKTLNAAITGLKPNGGIIQIGVGAFQAPDADSLYSNLSFRGAGVPQPNSSTPSGFILGKGTIITGGPFANQGSNGSRIHGLSFTNLGVDAYDGNNGAFNFTYTGQDAFTNLYFDNIEIIARTGSQANGNLSHGMSLEQISYSNFNNIRVWYGVHGMAVKTRHCNFSNLHLAGADSDSIILKNGLVYGTSIPLPCEYNNFTNINLGKVSNNKTAGIFIDNYIGIRNINMTNIVGEGVYNPIQIETASFQGGISGKLTDIIIDNATFSSGSGLGINFASAAPLGNITIKDLSITDHSGDHAFSIGARMDPYSRLKLINPRATNNFGGNGFLFAGSGFSNIDIIDPQADLNSGVGYLFYNNSTSNVITRGLKGSGNAAGFSASNGGWWAPEKAYTTANTLVPYATVLKTQYLTVKNTNAGNNDLLMQLDVTPYLFYNQYGGTLEIYSAGTFAENNNKKSISAYYRNYNGTLYTLYESTPQIQSGGAWSMRTYITSYPDGSNFVYKVSTEFKSNNTGYKTIQYTGLSGYILNNTYQITASGGAPDDISQEQMIATCLNAN
jgi:hypothetical protein